MADAIVKPTRRSFQDLTGKRFGRLTVREYQGIQKRHYYWSCVCDCGNETVVDGGNLRGSVIQSCGCLQVESIVKHGMYKSAEYAAWSHFKNRCTNKNDRAYANYGGRGISVCERWINSFENFLHDMGARPSPKHSIDRIDNDGNYEPVNCRWTTTSIQNHNKRKRSDAKSSQFKGVTKRREPRRTKPWGAMIMMCGKKIRIGQFATELEAAVAYDQAAIKLFGPTALINFKNGILTAK